MKHGGIFTGLKGGWRVGFSPFCSMYLFGGGISRPISRVLLFEKGGFISLSKDLTRNAFKVITLRRENSSPTFETDPLVSSGSGHDVLPESAFFYTHPYGGDIRLSTQAKTYQKHKYVFIFLMSNPPVIVLFAFLLPTRPICVVLIAQQQGGAVYFFRPSKSAGGT